MLTATIAVLRQVDVELPTSRTGKGDLLQRILDRHEVRQDLDPETADTLQLQSAASRLAFGRHFNQRSSFLPRTCPGLAPDHLELASTLTSLARALLLSADDAAVSLALIDESRVAASRALSIKVQMFGPASPKLLTTLIAAGNGAADDGDSGAVATALRWSAAIVEDSIDHSYDEEIDVLQQRHALMSREQPHRQSAASVGLARALTGLAGS